MTPAELRAELHRQLDQLLDAQAQAADVSDDLDPADAPCPVCPRCYHPHPQAMADLDWCWCEACGLPFAGQPAVDLAVRWRCRPLGELRMDEQGEAWLVFPVGRGESEARRVLERGAALDKGHLVVRGMVQGRTLRPCEPWNVWPSKIDGDPRAR